MSIVADGVEVDGRSVHAKGAVVEDRIGEQHLLAGFLGHCGERVEVDRLKYGLLIDVDQEITAAYAPGQGSQGHSGGRGLAATDHRKKKQQEKKAAHGFGFLY
jgi:hypothetical protein